jgi:TusA-related sulfurtransferase
MADLARDDRLQEIGSTWIQAIVEHDYQQLARLCRTDVRSRLVTPSGVDSGGNVNDLIGSIQGWFGETSHTQVQYARVDQVGQKAAINYRLIFREGGEWFTAEQQVYATLSDGLIARLDLLCSGFQPVPVPVELHDDDRAESERPEDSVVEPILPAADALLVFNTQPGDQGPTCSVLTPAIKARLGEIRSGQVLEVRVDDPEAKADIESWSRLSGNELLAVTTRQHPPEGRGELSFYLKKK